MKPKKSNKAHVKDYVVIPKTKKNNNKNAVTCQHTK